MQLIQELNNRAWGLTEHCQNLAELLKIKILKDDSGAKIMDFGVNHPGTLSAGTFLARICTADLADIQVLFPGSSELPLPQVQVSTDFPLAACVAAQYAGWPFSHGDYFAMCSGPARMARGKEDLLIHYDLEFAMERVVGILESDKYPNSDAIRVFAQECRVEPVNVTLCVARTASMPGSLQVVARSIETTLHKLHELRFDLNSIHSAIGSAPLPPIAADDLTSLGWTNDAILYGAQTQLWVDTTDELIEAIGPRIPSNHSTDFGTPFSQIFERYDRDFYKIDKMLFSPAKVILNNLNSGRTFQFGELRNDILTSAYGLN